MERKHHELSESLWIDTGIPGAEQESNFMNATLQKLRDENVDFSVACHIGVGAEVKTEEQLFDYLADLLGRVTEAFPDLNFEVQIGPYGEGDDDA